MALGMGGSWNEDRCECCYLRQEAASDMATIRSLESKLAAAEYNKLKDDRVLETLKVLAANVRTISYSKDVPRSQLKAIAAERLDDLLNFIEDL